MLIVKYVGFFMLFSLNVFATDFIAMEDYKPIGVPEEVEVKLSNNTYLVTNVSVSGLAESDSQAFDNGLYSAKFIAFRAVKNKIQDTVLLEDSETIDSAMAGFVPAGGSFEDGVFNAKFNILFDKDKIASLISENKMVGEQKARSGSQSIVARIAIKNDIANWVKIRYRMDKNNINYAILSLSLSEVEILFKDINVLKLTDALGKANLDLVSNRDFYFIKVPLFS